MGDSVSVVEQAAQSAPRRSGLVSAAGIALALFPWVALTLALALTPRDSGLWTALPSRDFTSIAVFVAIAAVCGAAGLAMWRRWRSWRFYAGIVAWFLIATTARVMLRLLWQVAWGLVPAWYIGAMSLPGWL